MFFRGIHTVQGIIFIVVGTSVTQLQSVGTDSGYRKPFISLLSLSLLATLYHEGDATLLYKLVRAVVFCYCNC